MASRRVRVLSTLGLAAVLAFPSEAQSVISARSGVIHFFEGSVYLGDQRLEPHLGRFPMMADGAQLRTGNGRAEVLLTPGVFLRIGDQSAVRMLKSDLADTRVELLSGSATIDCTQTGPGSSVALIYRQWTAHFLEKGLYRVDTEPPVLWVRMGKAEVAQGDQAPVTVEHGSSLPFAAVLVPDRSAAEPDDALADWSIGRRQSIIADDAISAQIDQDPASGGGLLAGVDGVTYFPLIGIPPVMLGSDAFYDVYRPYQAGFNSIYFPGYRYRPFGFSGFSGGAYRSPYSWGVHSPGPYGPPRSTGVPPGIGTRLPGSIYSSSPRPTVRPVAPVHPPPASHGGGGAVHAGRGR